MEQSDRDISQWDARLKEQLERSFHNYHKRRIDLSVARDNKQFDLTGETIIVEKASSATAIATVRLMFEDADELTLAENVEINSIFKGVFLSNAAQADAWLDVIAGINFEYKKKIAAEEFPLLIIDGQNYSKDAVGIRAAIADLPITGGTLILSPGLYDMTKDGVNNYCVLVDRPVFFRGLGGGFGKLNNDSYVTQLLLANNQNCKMFLFQPQLPRTQIYFGGFYNLEIDGNKDNNAVLLDHFIKFESTSDVVIKNCVIHEVPGQPSWAVLFFDQNSWGPWVLENDFEDNESWCVWSETHRTWVENNHFRDEMGGVKVNNSGIADQQGGWILNNDFRNLGWRCIYLIGTSQGYKIMNNVFMDSCSTGVFGAIELKDQCKNIDIISNRIHTGSDFDYGLRISDNTVDKVNALYNDFNLATTPYSFVVGANANGVVIDLPNNGAADHFWGGLRIPGGTTPGPNLERSFYLDTDDGANGTVKCYSNGAWRTVAVL